MGRALPNYKVVIDPEDLSGADGSNYADLIEGNLNHISGRVTGRAILAKIRAHGWVRIVPFGPDLQKKWGTCNALTHYGPIVNDLDNTEFDGRIQIMGKTAKIDFSATTWGAAGSCSQHPGARADENLHHELVHAGRMLGDDFKQIPTTGVLTDYENNEEFYAVTITNIYMSEAGRTGDGIITNLRADHGWTPMIRPMAISEVFLSIPGVYDLIETYCDQHPNIAPLIATAPADFNPLRTYYEWKAKGYKPPS